MVRFGVLKESAPRAASPYLRYKPSGRLIEEARSAPDWIDYDVHPSMRPPGDQIKRREARLTGFEPVTVRLEGGCSIQLSYRRCWGIVSSGGG